MLGLGVFCIYEHEETTVISIDLLPYHLKCSRITELLI